MDCEHKLKALEQEIESLKEENRLLKENLLLKKTLIALVSRRNMR